MHPSDAPIPPPQVRTAADIRKYYKQRLGENFKNLPCLKLPPVDYKDFFLKKEGIFQRSHLSGNVLLNALFVAPPSSKRDHALITFPIEKKDTGQDLLEILSKNLNSLKERKFYEALCQLHVRCAQLRLDQLRKPK